MLDKSQNLSIISTENYLKTAIDLKLAIDRAPNVLSPIGTSKNEFIDWKINNFGDDDYEYVKEKLDEGTEKEQETEEIDDDYDNEIIEENYKNYYYTQKLQECMKERFYHTFQFPKDEKEDESIFKIKNSSQSEESIIPKVIIRKDGQIVYQGDFNISQSILKDLFDKAVDSPYGDVKNMETKIDKQVRDAREFTEVEVSQNILDKIADEWSKNLFPKKVKAVPYKVNLYNEKGFFKIHRDTPQTNLVGTALISLWMKDAKYLGSFNLEHKKENFEWYPKKPECLMFYTDCPHEVRKSYSIESTVRATLSFKIFEDIQDNGKNDNKNDIIIDRMVEILKKLQIGQKNIGFILSHDYSLNINSLKGNDALIAQAVQKLSGNEIIIIPIIHKFHLDSDHNGYENFSSKIYPLTDEHLQWVLSSGKGGEYPNTIPYDDISFYNLQSNTYNWSYFHEDYSEHTGNESRPEEIDSVYISRAIIIPKI